MGYSLVKQLQSRVVGNGSLNSISILPPLTDFGLYKRVQCGKVVMGYEKEKHEQDVHGGKSVE
jgi:hypothetical protein